MAKHNPTLEAHAHRIIKIPRYSEVIAISMQETNLCKTGIAKTLNNCGGIKDSSTGLFKRYISPVESLEDIARVIERPHLKGKTIEQMNGIYCVVEQSDIAKNPKLKLNAPCPQWDTNINNNLINILLN